VVNKNSPIFVLKPDALIQAAHNLSSMAQKLVNMGLALCPPDLSTRDTVFLTYTFYNTLGFPRGGRQYRQVSMTVSECASAEISVDGGRQVLRLFDSTEFDTGRNAIRLRFGGELAAYLSAAKLGYTRLELRDIGALRSAYAIRLFEIAMSYAGFDGKKGNKSTEWFLERRVDQWCCMLGVQDGVYTRANNFRQFCFTAPIAAINGAGLGVELKLKTLERYGVVFYRVSCRHVPRVIKRTGGEPLVLPIDTPKAQTWDDAETERLRLRYPEEFAALYEKALEALPDLGGKGEGFER
jgi:hypothetical protein